MTDSIVKAFLDSEYNDILRMDVNVIKVSINGVHTALLAAGNPVKFQMLVEEVNRTDLRHTDNQVLGGKVIPNEAFNKEWKKIQNRVQNRFIKLVREGKAKL